MFDSSSRKKGIFIALILTLVFTVLITIGANSKNMAANKKVDVLVANRSIPYGAVVMEGDYEKVSIPENMAKGIVADPGYFKDKTLILPIGQGHYIYENSFREGQPKKPGYSEVFIEVDLYKSALALPGEYVDLVPIDNRNEGVQKEPICKSVRVLHAVDSKGWDVDPVLIKESITKGLKTEDKKFPVTVGLEVPAELVTSVVPFADKRIQLVKGDTP